MTAIAAIIINYVKKDEVVGNFLETNFRWQMRTFWFGLLWAVVGALTAAFIMGFIFYSCRNKGLGVVPYDSQLVGAE